MSKTCDIVGCDNTFDKSEKHRVRLTKKKDKGEKVAYICPNHGLKFEEKMEFRGD